MGLGKSLQAISVIACSQDEAHKFSSFNNTSTHSTLIICPARLINNWINEIQKHTHQETIKFIKYHGPERHSHPIESIISANIIVTSYEIVRTEFQEFEKISQNKPSYIFSRSWFRLILDEAQ